MNGLEILLTLENDQRQYLPGDTLSGHFIIRGAEPAAVKAIELSVLWSTEGKGEEDLAVHFFDRLEPEVEGVDIRQPCKFKTRLPSSPLSYEGLIVKICWCVRLRVLNGQGKELIAEKSFQLGAVPPAVWSPP